MARSNPLEGRRIALGVTGSIAAYKAVALASSLTQAGAHVDVLMTPEATRLVQPLSFAAITHRPVVVDMFELLAETEIGHVTIAHAADLFVVAPATAHSIAKLALGLADDMVTTTALATRAPSLLAPAMETNMWCNPVTQGHVTTLRERGWTIVEPDAGHLASGAAGEGRLAAPERILDVAKYVLARDGDLAGYRIVVTAGGTREPLDPVRYISNRSSGKMGYALAEAARDRGARVTLVTTVTLPAPVGVEVVPVERAMEMHDAVLARLAEADVLVMAAAVADYEPATRAEQKIKKSGAAMMVELTQTPDIIAEAAQWRGERRRPVIIGFAAETEQLLAHAQDKLTRKGMDLIVANDVTLEGSGFASDDNKVTILAADGHDVDLPLMSKLEVAHHVWDEMLLQRAARG
ncbi:MAG: phosphopantothenoylcysteine decarboxylase / phosphopantothenate---cysteine ligase [Chloroflexota bacterium]|jgi:phosphopantothenoylcysteine decarboxylase/phosphopantothenate--cysteine ligase|nr:phosphopantothenoylcysteine decarboxylase / phosphopantothenate---cysteine ligase [Chloroflexota bacterium]